MDQFLFCPVHGWPLIFDDNYCGKCTHPKCNYTLKSILNNETGNVTITMTLELDIEIKPKKD